jgi:hypothetical protein
MAALDGLQDKFDPISAKLVGTEDKTMREMTLK